MNFDLNKWSYLETLGILKDLGYKEVDTIRYKEPTFYLKMLNNDKGVEEFVD